MADACNTDDGAANLAPLAFLIYYNAVTNTFPRSANRSDRKYSKAWAGLSLSLSLSLSLWGTAEQVTFDLAQTANFQEGLLQGRSDVITPLVTQSSAPSCTKWRVAEGEWMNGSLKRQHSAELGQRLSVVPADQRVAGKSLSLRAWLASWPRILFVESSAHTPDRYCALSICLFFLSF